LPEFTKSNMGFAVTQLRMMEDCEKEGKKWPDHLSSKKQLLQTITTMLGEGIAATVGANMTDDEMCMWLAKC